jgi:flagellar export protein FliJ
MTKRYRFPLAQVLRVRRIEEAQAAGRLAAARAEAAAAAARHESRRSVLAGMSAPAGPVASKAFLAWHDQVGRAGIALQGATAAHQASLAALDERRVEYTGAAGKVSALERLDERRRDEHHRDALQEEAAILDDLVMARRSGAADRAGSQ